MKLTVKLIFTTVLIVALAVSICSYLLLSGSFRSELNMQYEAAMQESTLFSSSMGNMALQTMANSFQDGAQESVERFLEGGVHLKRYAYQVLTGDGTVLSASTRQTPRLSAADAGTTQVLAQIFRDGERYTMETVQCIQVAGEDFIIRLFRDVTDIFTARDRNLHLSALAILGALAVSTTITVVVSLFFVSPVRKLSSTTRLMAAGQYTRRAQVHTQDELGALAQDFNRMADTVEHQIRQLEDAAQRERDFTASFAHEIKTPLTSVIGYADTLRSRELPRAQQVKAADYIFSEGKRLETMSHALLDLFALEKAAPQMQPVDMQELLEAVASRSRMSLAEKGLTLQVTAEPALLQVEPTLLHTLFYNLLDNARKASPPGSTLELLGQAASIGYRVQVRDHGRGIPPEAIARLTEPFYMVDKSRSRAEGGAGLGLALCRRIAQVHGGTLSFESQEGEGTTVTVEIGGGV